jgi:hypothetical protein
MPFGAVIVDVPGGYNGNPETIGQATQAPVPVAVAFLLVVLKLDEEISVSESALEASR